MTTERKPILVAQQGDRVKVETQDGVVNGTVEDIDESTFPGKVVIRTDGGSTVEVPIGIGWPDD